LLSGRRKTVYALRAMNDPDLDRLLRTWSTPNVPADEFRRQVWQRIAHGDAAPSRASRWLDALLRPRVAFAGFAAALVIGTAGGVSHASIKQRVAPVTVADSTAAYVQSINPLDPVHLRHAGEMR
jgi:hypothetical protein